MWEPGLPAMQTPRCISDTQVMLSQASQLPHKSPPTFGFGGVSYGGRSYPEAPASLPAMPVV
ncbi:hypothetical protein E1K68_25415 [Pseudomonas sp. B2021]|nr:hypothetical protein [Pseudomonas sp. B2021]TKK11554.1 hypothetical protein PflCFBP13510_14340 [Pseudomonas fluorescens]